MDCGGVLVYVDKVLKPHFYSYPLMPTMTGSGVLQTIKEEISPTHLEYRPKIPIPSISDTGKIPIPKNDWNHRGIQLSRVNPPP